MFALDYYVDSPLNAVVHAEAAAKYRTAFSMLWRLKRVEWSLSASWKQLMTLSHSAWRGHGRDGRIGSAWRQEFPKLLPVLHRCTLSRGKMAHFVQNLSAFLMFEVLETAWVGLQEDLQTAKSLDDVIMAHDAYLSEILNRSLVGPQHEALNQQVQKLLQAILKFCSLETSLMTDATVAIARRRRVREEIMNSSINRSMISGKQAASGLSRRGSGRFNIEHTDLEAAGLVEPPGSYDGVPAYMVTRVDEAVQDYTTAYAGLMRILQEHGDRGDMARFLTFRLEFNERFPVSGGQGQSEGKGSRPPGAPGASPNSSSSIYSYVSPGNPSQYMMNADMVVRSPLTSPYTPIPQASNYTHFPASASSTSSAPYPAMKYTEASPTSHSLNQAQGIRSQPQPQPQPLAASRTPAGASGQSVQAVGGKYVPRTGGTGGGQR